MIGETVSPHFWRRSELQIVRDHYPKSGAKAVGRLLPHRSICSIYARANLLGLERPRGKWSRVNG